MGFIAVIDLVGFLVREVHHVESDECEDFTRQVNEVIKLIHEEGKRVEDIKYSSDMCWKESEGDYGVSYSALILVN